MVSNESTGSLYFFAAGNEVRPIRAFYQDVGKHLRNQLARGVFVEEGDGIDRLESQRHLGSLGLGEQRTVGSLRPPHTRIGVQRQDEDVAEGARLLQQPDVAGMQQVIAAVGENYGFPFLFPLFSLFEKLFSKIQAGHCFSVPAEPKQANRSENLLQNSSLGVKMRFRCG